MSDSPDSKIISYCPGCDKKFRVRKEFLGQRIKCNACGASFPVKKEDSIKSKSIIEEQHQTIKEQKKLLLQYQKELIQAKKNQNTSSDPNLDDSKYNSIEGLESMLLRLDQHGLIQYINSTFCKKFNTTSDELLHKPISTLKRLLPGPLYLSLDRPEEQGSFDETVKDGTGRVFEVRKTLSKQQLDIVLNDVTDEQKFKDYVSKYVSSDLLELSDAELQTFRIPERRFMTVSFTDLRGFTAMSETLSPEEVRTTMNSYLEEIIYAINSNQATVDKIVGDEVMALYGAPKYYKDHAFRAIKTACDQIYNLKALQKTFRNIGKSIPDCGIGINSGDMVVGNMGSSTHQDYTVLGAAVNLAARLCGAAMGSQIITTENTLKSVIENLPENWSSQIVENKVESDSSSMRGKVESIKPLPDNLVGKSYLIGPQDGLEIKPFFKFDYQFLIQAKGVQELIPIISVSDQRAREERKDELLSEETITTSNDRIFGKYRLVELLGRGGMGEVWKARDPFGNTFAVKMLIAGDAASEHQIARFKREAKIMSKLNHRGLCKIIEIGEVEKTTYIAMEYIDGVTLSDIFYYRRPKDQSSLNNKTNLKLFELGKLVKQIKEAMSDPEYRPSSKKKCYPLPTEATVDLLIKCCQAIEYAHEYGILHRDLKPANIMIREDGDPIIMDFGLAKISEHADNDHIEASMSLSVSGEIVGSIEYMSPEQAEASKFVDMRADVYSLGAILYQALSGKKYFESSGNLLSDINQLEDYEGLRVKDVARHIDTDLDIISYKSLRPVAEERYQDMASFRLDLQRYSIGESISARDITTFEIISKLTSRYKGIVATGVVSLSVIIIGSILFVINLNNQKEEAQRALEMANFEQGKRIETEKENAPIWYVAALERASVGKMNASLGLINKALELSNNNLEYIKVKGEILLYLEKYSEAHQLFLPLIVDHPKDQELKLLERISKRLLIDPNKEFEHYQLLEYLTKKSRPFLARLHGSDITFGAFKQSLQNKYSNFDLSNRIQTSDIKGRFDVDFSGLDINDLSPLKGWKLNYLGLRKTGVKNYNILQDLDFLKINIMDPELENINFLKGKNLEEIQLLECHRVVDLTPINGIELKHISLHQEIKDFSPISFQSLESFHYVYGQKQNFKLSFLKDSSIKELILRDIPNLDFSILEGATFEKVKLTTRPRNRSDILNIEALESCESLELNYFKLKNLDFINELGVKELCLENCQIEDYSALYNTQLRQLSLINCNIENLEFLTQQSSIKYFEFSSPSEQNFNTLKGLTLDTLILPKQKLNDLDFVKGINGLRQIHFDPSLIKRTKWIYQLQRSPKLRYLHLKHQKNISLSLKEFLELYYRGNFGEVPEKILEQRDAKLELLTKIKSQNPEFTQDGLIAIEVFGGEVISIGIQNSPDIRDLSFLESYPRLKKLKLEKLDNVYKFNVLEKLTQLNELDLSGTIHFKQAPLLTKLPLRSLVINGLDDFNFSTIMKMPYLDTLVAYGSYDLSGLKSKSITHLYLKSNLIKKGLMDLKNLSALKYVHDDLFPKINQAEKYFIALEFQNKLINEIIGSNPTALFKDFHFQGFDSLNLIGRPRITNLSFLKEFPSINQLSLGHTIKRPNFESIYNREWKQLILKSPHISTKDLENMVSRSTDTLNLEETQIKDIGFLKGNQLKELWLNKTPVTNISALSSMDSLERLGIMDTNVKNLSPLRQLNLQHLSFSPTQFDAHNLKIIRHKHNLKTVSTFTKEPNQPFKVFWNNYFDGDYGEPLSELVEHEQQLKSFHRALLNENPNAQQAFIQYEAPDYLDISGNEFITNLNFLKEFPDINTLRLKYLSNELMNFNPLFERPIIKELVVDGTNFGNSDLAQCAKFYELEELSIQNTAVTSIHTIRHLKLKKLWATNTKVRDFSLLKDMSSLENLNLANTPNKNLNFIKNLNLKTFGFTPRQYNVDNLRHVINKRTIEQFIIENEFIPSNEFWKNYFEGVYGPPFKELQQEVYLLIKLYYDLKKTNPNYEQNEHFNYTTKNGRFLKLNFGGIYENNQHLLDLSFIKDFKDINQLDLSQCQNIKDFSHLQGLTYLKRLSLDHCKNFNNLLSLKNLPINSLSINGLPHLDLSHLKEFPDLKELHITSHSDFRSLANLQLETISINSNQENLIELETLRSMNSLKQINDETFPTLNKAEMYWPAFERHQKLKLALRETNPKLLLTNNNKILNNAIILNQAKNLNDISFLKDYHHIQYLQISQTDVNDFNSIKDLIQLKQLKVGHTDFNNQDLELISDKTHLFELSLNNTNITDISSLKDLSLEKLSLTSCDIQDLTPIEGMKQLNTLYIDNIKPNRISFLYYLKKLRNLVFTPKLLKPEMIKRLHSFKFIESLGVSPDKLEPAHQFWEKYFNEEYGEVDERLIIDQQLEKEVILAIQKDNPTFEPDENFSMRFLNQKLYDLKIGGTRVNEPVLSLKNINFLRNYPSLRYLRLTSCYNLKNFKPIQSLKNLENLAIGGNPHFNDLSLLKDLPIEKLQLGGLKGLDFDLIKNKKIESITFNSRHHKNVKSLKEIQSLHTIYDDALPRVSAIKRYWELYDRYQKILQDILLTNPNLTLDDLELNLNFKGEIDTFAFNTRNRNTDPLNNTLKNLSFIKKHPKIKSFLLIVNEAITDFSYLKYLEGTTQINLAKTHFADLNLINHLPLKTLYLNNTNVIDLSPLRNCNLEMLFLSGQNRISSLEAISHMDKLHTLAIPYCTNINDLSPLSNLALKRLSFNPQYITKGLDLIRSKSSITHLSEDVSYSQSAASFWKNFDQRKQTE